MKEMYEKCFIENYFVLISQRKRKKKKKNQTHEKALFFNFFFLNHFNLNPGNKKEFH